MRAYQDRVPCDEVYWSVVGLSERHVPTNQELKLKRFNALQLGELIEEQLPLRLSDVQLASLRAGGRVVTCAIRSDALARRLEQQPELVSLIPESVPDCVAKAAPELIASSADLLHMFELLDGEYAPSAVRRVRGTRRLVAAVGVVLVSLTLAASWQIRAGRAHADTKAAHDVTEKSLTLLVNALNQTPGPDASPAQRATMPTISSVAFSLASELEAARKNRPRGKVQVKDAATTLSAFLAHWPKGTVVAVDQISVQQSAVFVQCVFESRSDADHFANGFVPPEGWTLDPSRMQASGQRTMLSMRFRAKEANTP